MAVHIPIILVERNGRELTYEYTQPDFIPDPTDAKRLVQTGVFRGVVTFNQDTGEFTHVTGTEWDSGTFFNHVCRKLAQHFEAGEVPEETEYAA